MTEKPAPVRRSAGMLGSPFDRNRGAVIAAAPSPRPGQVPPATSVSRPCPRPKPQVLMSEVAGARGLEIGEHRKAFRAFMMARGLRPSQWAKMAGVPVGEILAYLTGRQRFFSPGVAERLAHAAGVTGEEMFQRRPVQK